MVYEHLLKEGAVKVSVTNPELLALLEEMNDSWMMCRGVANYSRSIGYDIKSLSLPVGLQIQQEKLSVQFGWNSVQVTLQFKWQLGACKKSSDELSPSNWLTRQSTFYLIYFGTSKNIKLDQNIHKKASGSWRVVYA